MLVVGLDGKEARRVERLWERRCPEGFKVRLRFVQESKRPSEHLHGVDGCVITSRCKHIWRFTAEGFLPSDLVQFTPHGQGGIIETISAVVQKAAQSLASCF